MPKKIAIIGGGITGLTAAYHLEQNSDCEITLIEPGQLGGKVGTICQDGCLMELGPDCFFSRKPEAMALIRRLGIESEVIEPKTTGFSVYVDGKLQEVPHALVNFANYTPELIDQTQFLSKDGRARAKEEPNQPRGTASDESIASFFRRRFGEEFSRKVVEPLMAGTHGGNAEALSMKALYPGYLDLERKNGSLTRPVESADRSAHSKPQQATFLSLREGMGYLPETIARTLQRTKIIAEGAFMIAKEAVSSTQGHIAADFVLCTAPAHVATRLLADSSSVLATELAKLEFAPSRIVTFAFNRKDVSRELAGTGFLVPQGEDEIISGCTYASQKWDGRAPNDAVLLRVFVKGDENEALARIKQILEIEAEPLFCKKQFWKKALPQYKVGHLEWLASLDEHLAHYPWLVLAGASYKGVGVPDCIRQGEEAAAKIIEKL